MRAARPRLVVRRVGAEMGKTPASKRLVIEVYPPTSEWPEMAELEAKGHYVRRREITEPAPDLVLGPTCWRMDEPLRKYLDTAVKEARAAKGRK